MYRINSFCNGKAFHEKHFYYIRLRIQQRTKDAAFLLWLQTMHVCYVADMRYELYGENTTLRGSRLCVIPYSLELHYQEGERSHEQRHAKALLSSVSLLTREKSCV